jgi:predicted nucleic acid-binding protein
MMIDSNIAIDLTHPNSPWLAWAARVVRGADFVEASALVVAELSLKGGALEEILNLLDSFRIEVVDFDTVAAFRAGRAQAAYRAAGGTREKLLGDFLIGAHAVTRKVPLATRDPKPYRTYFPELTLITPETDHG